MSSLGSLVRSLDDPLSEQDGERFWRIFAEAKLAEEEAEDGDATPDEGAACDFPHLEVPSSGNNLGEEDVGDGNVSPEGDVARDDPSSGGPLGAGGAGGYDVRGDGSIEGLRDEALK